MQIRNLRTLKPLCRALQPKPSTNAGVLREEWGGGGGEVERCEGLYMRVMRVRQCDSWYARHIKGGEGMGGYRGEEGGRAGEREREREKKISTPDSHLPEAPPTRPRPSRSRDGRPCTTVFEAFHVRLSLVMFDAFLRSADI